MKEGEQRHKEPKGEKKKEPIEVGTTPEVKDREGEVIPSEVIIRPRITEKSGQKAQNDNVYTFDVSPRAGKRSISRAFETIYNLKPLKVRVSAIPRKRVFVRGKWGSKGGGRKAYVYLKEGEKIEFI